MLILFNSSEVIMRKPKIKIKGDLDPAFRIINPKKVDDPEMSGKTYFVGVAVVARSPEEALVKWEAKNYMDRDGKNLMYVDEIPEEGEVIRWVLEDKKFIRLMSYLKTDTK